MSQLIAGKRYARALFQLASEKGNITELEQDLTAVIDAIRQDEQFHTILLHPNIAVDAKAELVKAAFSGKVADEVLHTILLVIQKGREQILPALLTSYKLYADEVLGRAQATVYSPIELSEKDIAMITAHFGKVTNKTIALTNVVKPELLGGIQVRIGDQVYDGSLLGKLKDMEKLLTQNAM